MNPVASIAHHKARLIAKGFHQRPDIYFTEIISPVAKSATIRLVFKIAVTNGWVRTNYMLILPFLKKLSLIVFSCSNLKALLNLNIPIMFINRTKLSMVLVKLLDHGAEFRFCLLAYGFFNSHSDISLFIFT